MSVIILNVKNKDRKDKIIMKKIRTYNILYREKKNKENIFQTSVTAYSRKEAIKYSKEDLKNYIIVKINWDKSLL